MVKNTSCVSSVQRNVSRLPMAMIDSVEMNLKLWGFQKKKEKIESKIVSSDSTIPLEQQIKWFKDRGITLFADIELNDAIYDLYFTKKRSFYLRIQGDREKFNASVLFSAEFNYQNYFSWLSMAYFLKLIYDQSTFVEELSMYAIDKKLKEILFTFAEKRYIRCGSFKLQVADGVELCESVSWLEQNVQADKIEIPTRFMDYSKNEICNAMSNFLLGASWISASQEVDLAYVHKLREFFRALVKKFRTVSAVQSTFPIITFTGYRYFGSFDDEQMKRLLSGKEELDDSEDKEGWEFSEDEKKGKMYTISNGTKQMQIEFKEPSIFSSAHNFGRCIQSSKFDIRVTVVSSFGNAIQ